MEDAHVAFTNLPNGTSLFGVFDGHGGKLITDIFQCSVQGHKVPLCTAGPFSLLIRIGQEVATFTKKHIVKCLTTLPSFK